MTTEMRITEIVEVGESVIINDNTFFPIFLVAETTEGEPPDSLALRVLATKPDRWKAGDVVEATDGGKEDHDSEGRTYRYAKLSKPNPKGGYKKQRPASGNTNARGGGFDSTQAYSSGKVSASSGREDLEEMSYETFLAAAQKAVADVVASALVVASESGLSDTARESVVVALTQAMSKATLEGIAKFRRIALPR
jgi:hypothetical protein